MQDLVASAQQRAFWLTNEIDPGTPVFNLLRVLRLQGTLHKHSLVRAFDDLIVRHDGKEMTAKYDGYGSCPLTVAYGKIVLAEFGYGGKITPSFPLDPRVPRRSAWYLKTKFLPWLYWSHMLVGGEFDIPHKERAFGAS